MEDVVIKTDKQKFNFRVAVIPYNNNNQVLMQRVKNEEYLSLIGGRVKLGETTANALLREVQEELGILINQKNLRPAIPILPCWFLKILRSLLKLLLCTGKRSRNSPTCSATERLWFRPSEILNGDGAPQRSGFAGTI